jgi:hypothetical protein
VQECAVREPGARERKSDLDTKDSVERRRPACSRAGHRTREQAEMTTAQGENPRQEEEPSP